MVGPSLLNPRAPQGPPNQPVPPGFLWAVATSGYQWEGGDDHTDWAKWQAAGHTRESVGHAADGWNRYIQDFDLAQAMGLNAFRISMEWSRIEPKPGLIDWEAVAHYHRMLAALHERGMEPIVTLLHSTYPAWLDAEAPPGKSAWEMPSTVDAYVRYVAFVSKEFGPEIRYYLTFNEPTVMVEGGYLAGVWPPGKKDIPAFLRASGNLIKAHSRAYDVIHTNDPNAMVSFNNYAAAYQLAFNPNNNTIPAPGEDWFLDAIGNALVPSETDQFGHRRLKLDYMAVDYYKRLSIPTQIIPPSPSAWHVYPAGMQDVLDRYYQAFHLPILIAENGLATDNGAPRADGWSRSRYLVDHVSEVQKAIARGIPVLGYTYWSLTDNYEWGSFDDRFGLYTVDCRHGNFTRVPTPAVETYKEIVSHHGVTPEIYAQYNGIETASEQTPLPDSTPEMTSVGGIGSAPPKP
jgi:beta-glucosidase